MSAPLDLAWLSDISQPLIIEDSSWRSKQAQLKALPMWFYEPSARVRKVLMFLHGDEADVGDITEGDWDEVRWHLSLDLISFVHFFCFFKDRNSRRKVLATPSAPQLALMWRIMYQVDAGVPVRVALLKERQGGFSWVVCQVVLWIICFQSNVNALHVAHDKATTNRIFMYLKEGHEWLVDNVRPEKVVDTKGELYLLNPDEDERRNGNTGQDSRTFCDTAGNNFVGTGQPVQVAHISEVGKWDKLCDPDTVYTSFANAIQDEPGTFIFAESTAHGAQTFWHDMWLAAMRMGTDSWNGFTPVFLPWYLDERNVAVAPPNMVYGEREDHEYGNEARIAKDFDLTPQQMAWRRSAIRKQPETRNKVETFNQEHPATQAIAWLFAHGKWLEPQLLEAAAARAKDDIAKRRLMPVFIGDMNHIRDQGVDACQQLEPEKERNNWLVRRNLGPLTIMRWPDWRHDYLITGDVAEGDGEDSSCAKVWQRIGNDSEGKLPLRLAAEWHGQIGEDVFADILWRLGFFYSTGRGRHRIPAMLAWERTGPGHVIGSLLRRHKGDKDIGYPHVRLYRKHDPNHPGMYQEMKYGISTNPQTKPVMMGLLMKALRDGVIQLTQRDVIELGTVTRNDRGLIQTGGRDRVMAAALACFTAAHTMPIWGQDDEPEQEIKEHSVKWTIEMASGMSHPKPEGETDEVLLT